MNQKAEVRDDEDARLLEAVADRRDREAYRALFDRYYPRVFVFVRRRLEDQELAREITSDVFLEVWASAPTFRGESKISSWIFGIARFKCLEALRQRGRLKRSRVIATEDEVIAQVPEERASATQLDAREDLRRLGRMLDRIPSDQRDALLWTVIEGQSLEEVAERQRGTRETVKTRVSRARRALRRMMGTAPEGAMDQEGA